MANKKILPHVAMDIYEEEMGIGRKIKPVDTPKMFDYYWHEHHKITSPNNVGDDDKDKHYIDAFLKHPDEAGLGIFYLIRINRTCFFDVGILMDANVFFNK